MNRITNSALYAGKSKRIRILYAAFVTVFLFAVTWLPHFYNVLQAYGTEGLQAPANSMDHLSKVSGMSVGTYLILILLIRLVGLLLSAGIVLYISTKVKSYSMTLLVSTGILLIPLVLYYLKLDWMKKVLMNFFFLMNIT